MATMLWGWKKRLASVYRRALDQPHSVPRMALIAAVVLFAVTRRVALAELRSTKACSTAVIQGPSVLSALVVNSVLEKVARVKTMALVSVRSLANQAVVPRCHKQLPKQPSTRVKLAKARMIGVDPYESNSSDVSSAVSPSQIQNLTNMGVEV
ncbi:MAG: hypothetical protein ABI698_01595 [bacterium]